MLGAVQQPLEVPTPRSGAVAPGCNVRGATGNRGLLGAVSGGGVSSGLATAARRGSSGSTEVAPPSPRVLSVPPSCRGNAQGPTTLTRLLARNGLCGLSAREKALPEGFRLGLDGLA